LMEHILMVTSTFGLLEIMQNFRRSWKSLGRDDGGGLGLPVDMILW
jgi:hypothetical protein